MSEIFEIIMVVSFGASWPLNVMKSYRARTTKLTAESFKWYVLFFYVLNLVMVGVDLILYWRNYKLDMAKEGK